MKKIISTNQAPAAIGPYSQAVQTGNMLFISGQIPVNPQTGELAGDDVKTQTKQVFENIRAILAEAGYEMQDIVKTTVFLADMSLFADMNEIYAAQFEAACPARSTIAVKGLPKGALVEIESIAVK